jgi:FixJ family two-component response regulator
MSDRASSMDERLVLLLDDDANIRKALINLFHSVGLRAEALGSAAELFQRKLPDIPSCLVLDISLPQISGLDLQDQLHRSGIAIPIIFITGHGDIQMSVKAMKAGAVDFLCKPFRDQDLLDAVLNALERDRRRRVEENSNLEIQARFALLTRRERQIMGLVTGGLMNKQVAGRIGISEVTVKIYRRNVMRKMRAKSLADLVLMGEKLGILGREDH